MTISPPFISLQSERDSAVSMCFVSEAPARAELAAAISSAGAVFADSVAASMTLRAKIGLITSNRWKQMSGLVLQPQVRGGSNQLDSGAISTQRSTSEVHRLKNVTAQAKEIRAAAVAWPIHLYRNDPLDPAGTRSHDNDAVAHVDGFIDVMSNKQHGRAPRLPEAQHFILHTHPRKGVERAKWFVEQEHFGMVDHRPRERDALGHASREMVRKGISKRFQTYQSHEFIDLTAFLFQHTARHETGFDVASHGEPRKKIRILKDKAPLGTWRGDWLVAY